MPWNLNSEKPIYAQIIDKVIQDIVSGHYSPGEKLPSVRDLAGEAAVNPNTMQKALSELERSGLVYSQRTTGRFITEDTKMIEQAKTAVATSQIQVFLENMKQLGFNQEDIINMIHKVMKEGQS